MTYLKFSIRISVLLMLCGIIFPHSGISQSSGVNCSSTSFFLSEDICGPDLLKCGDKKSYGFFPDREWFWDSVLYTGIWSYTYQGQITVFPDSALSKSIQFPDAVGHYNINYTIQRYRLSANSDGGYDRTNLDVRSYDYPVYVGPHLLAKPGAIPNPGHICYGANYSLSVPPVDDATHYRWIAPAGWKFSNNSNSILTSSPSTTLTKSSPFGSGAVNIRVRAENVADDCFSSSAYRDNFFSYGVDDVEIIGATTVNSSEGRYYQLDNPSETSNVSWTVPIGWSLQGGQGTNAIMVFTGNFGGKIKCTYTSCGATFNKELDIAVGSNPFDPGFGKRSPATSVQVYPNPVIETLFIEGEQPLGQITILNSLSEEVYAAEANDNKVEVDMADFAPGVYVLRVESEGIWTTHKILAQ